MKFPQSLGSKWLMEQFQLPELALVHHSCLGKRRLTEHKADGSVVDFFTKRYWPGDSPLNHVEFMLKYEELSLDLLEQVFKRLTPSVVDEYLASAKTSKYGKRIGFLYEFLTPNKLQTQVAGNFVSVLDPVKYFTGNPVRNTRWRVFDNLLGTSGVCPLIRKTPAILQKLQADWPTEIRKLTHSADARHWNRAVNYLYLKETKASFAIEREEVTPERSERFVALLEKCGTGDPELLLNELRLAGLQNIIVDPRYAETSFRTTQNYVGQTMPNFQEHVHYVCPAPELVRTLLAGLRSFRLRSQDLPAPVRAAAISFSFVYIHPFLDGNGRLHRLLLHDSLASDHYTDPGVVLPFSSAMLRDNAAYDRVLECVSKVVGKRVRYHLDPDQTLILENAREAEGVWRYLDLTPHVEFILDLIRTTVERDLPQELEALNRIDQFTTKAREIVDLPQRKQSLLLTLLRENGGRLSERKRKTAFGELHDEEIQALEAAYRDCFNPH